MNKETMTSRERVRNAVAHKPVDRVPIDLGAHFSTGISGFSYYRLRKHLGLATDHIEMIDMVQCLARVDVDIIQRFHIDTMLLNPPWKQTCRWNVGGASFHIPAECNITELPNGGYEIKQSDCTLYMPKGGYFFDGGWPDFYQLPEDEKTDYFAQAAEYIYHETDKYTIQMGFSGYFDGLDFACDMLTDPEMCIERNKQTLKNEIEKFDRINKAYGRYIQAIEVNSDLGMQSGLMCTPSSYEQVCYPFLKQFCDHVHAVSDIKIFFHSCGSIRSLLTYIVDAGVDILNPVQISAEGMDSKLLKDEYGHKICFWGGGCDTQKILHSGTPTEIARHVAKQIEIFKPMSGYVFSQVHNIMGNVPPENIVAMLDAAYENSF
ncbi:MAG: uroporphyrinogen decarboxylase family protein [Clostridia bacterium]|nr:uroporphyrinogen decarboxylase family protein [Clostridia bacterium]